MSYDSPFKLRVWHDNQMVMVQTLCHNQGGALWYGAGSAFGWAWVNPEYDGWTADNRKPEPADVSPVMRFTGLKDMVGQDIWEGDIVEIRCYDGWKDTIGFTVAYEIKWSLAALGWRGFRLEMDTTCAGVEIKDCPTVVGSIYQNPDLLKT